MTVLLRRFLKGLQASKETVALVIGPSGEVESVLKSAPASVAERERPKALDHDRPFVLGVEQAVEMAFCVEGHDRAAAEIADQQLIRVLAERAWRQRDSPRRINLLQLSAGIFARGKSQERTGYGDEGIY